MFTCDTCQKTLGRKPLWFCSLCSMKQHRGHAMSECTKATQQQIREACQGIASSGRPADMYIGFTMSHLNRAVKETELISELLNKQKRGFSRLRARAQSAHKDLTREDLATSLQEANDLKHKFEQASAITMEVGKDVESTLRDCRETLEDLFPREVDEEPMEAEGSETSRNNFDHREFDDGQRALGLCNNLLKSVNDNITHATLTELNLRGNEIARTRGFEALVSLAILDVSFNRLRKIRGLTKLVNLKCIHLEHNVIEKMDGLGTLVNLECLQLSYNRIKTIKNLDSQRKLSELYLSKNRIRRIENIGTRVTKLENLGTLVDLQELHVAEQGIETFEGIQNLVYA